MPSRPSGVVVSGLGIAVLIACAIATPRRAQGDAEPTPQAGLARHAEGAGRDEEVCPPTMVLVPAGKASLGAAADPDALAPVTREMSAFCIDRTEVTVAQYAACVAAGGCPRPATTISFPGFGPPEPMRTELSRFCNASREGHANHPLNCVDEATAAHYCAWEGGRLPEEEEWEYAARGANGQLFPWGSSAPSAPAGDLCWDRRGGALGTCPVGQFPAGASPAGALDMAGNVSEWTASRVAQSGEGGQAAGAANVVRGGGWPNFLPRFVSATYRWPLPPTTRLNCLGFRCASAVRSLGARP